MKYYGENKKIAIHGSEKEIDAAIRMLDSIPGLDMEEGGFGFAREGHLRLQIQDMMERMPIKATILVDGNTVYPYGIIIKEFRRLKEAGTLQKMSKRFYEFLYLNFDIAHSDKYGYITTYNNRFKNMYDSVLAKGKVHIPGWHTDLQKILDTIWEEMEEIKKMAA